jgi:hypothetical protein
VTIKDNIQTILRTSSFRLRNGDFLYYLSIVAASQALAATNPAEVEKNLKSLGPLQVEYNGKVYEDGKTITISNGDTESTLGFLLKNIVEGETLSWEIKNKGSVLHNYTANPIGLIWPDNANSVTIEAKSGSRTIKLELTKKTFTYTDLVATDKGNRKALASKNETLYIVRVPGSNRTVKYEMTTNVTSNSDFNRNEPAWSTTFGKGGSTDVYGGTVLVGSLSSKAETRHSRLSHLFRRREGV